MPRGWQIFRMAGSLVRYLSIGLLLVLLCACQQKKVDETLHLSGLTMGTTWSVSLLPNPDKTDPAALREKLQQRLDQINGLMSTYDPASEISRFNNQTGSDWFPVSTETFRVVELSQEISQLTGGAFDISVGPLVEAWGFGASARGEKIPSDQLINSLLDRVGYGKLELRQDPPALRKRVPLLRIDLSAVAKGYAVDELAELLRQEGINDFLLEVGGEMQLAGKKADGTPWKIGLERPLEDVREVETIMPLTGTALATSGNYRNFYVEDGQRYAHTIDPVSGHPVRHKLASVTVLDPSCARADALATALMVLGEVRGRELCEKLGIAAFFLIHDLETLTEYSSPEFTAFMEKMRK